MIKRELLELGLLSWRAKSPTFITFLLTRLPALLYFRLMPKPISTYRPPCTKTAIARARKARAARHERQGRF